MAPKFTIYRSAKLVYSLPNRKSGSCISAGSPGAIWSPAVTVQTCLYCCTISFSQEDSG